MAKCIKKNLTGDVYRTDNATAHELVTSGGWEYCPKSV